MQLSKRDWCFITIVGAVLAVLLMNGMKPKPKRVPANDTHRPFLEAVARGETRAEVEKSCAKCHNRLVIPLPPKHPPKEQCLICHRGDVGGK